MAKKANPTDIKVTRLDDSDTAEKQKAIEAAQLQIEKQFDR